MEQPQQPKRVDERNTYICYVDLDHPRTLADRNRQLYFRIRDISHRVDQVPDKSKVIPLVIDTHVSSFPQDAVFINHYCVYMGNFSPDYIQFVSEYLKANGVVYTDTFGTASIDDALYDVHYFLGDTDIRNTYSNTRQ